MEQEGIESAEFARCLPVQNEALCGKYLPQVDHQPV
jgi:hypothetical protein